MPSISASRRPATYPGKVRYVELGYMAVETLTSGDLSVIVEK
jgi:hypothetical protein